MSKSDRCWTIWEYEKCPPAPKRELVQSAKFVFTNDLFEYGDNGTGREKNLGEEQGNWTRGELENEYGIKDLKQQDLYLDTPKFYAHKYEIDCYGLIQRTLEANGYHGMRWNSPFQILAFPSDYFCQVNLGEVAPGDIVLLKNVNSWKRHVGFYDIDPATGKARVFSAENEVKDISFSPFPPDLVVAIYRPRRKVLELKCKDPNPPAVAFAIWMRDPLLVDLDGGGIKTVGLNAGIRFDHDKNGHKELTGWVAAGDGVLMLDMNGNGRLDNGRELFGNYTVLPDGTKAANGFQALAS